MSDIWIGHLNEHPEAAVREFHYDVTSALGPSIGPLADRENL